MQQIFGEYKLSQLNTSQSVDKAKFYPQQWYEHRCVVLRRAQAKQLEDYLGGSNSPNFASTSPSSGKRPASALEKIFRPSTITSNWPVLPGRIWTSSPN
jgi:hypothetical protein